MIRFILAIALLLAPSLSVGQSPSIFLSDSSTSRLGLGIDLQGGIGKAKERLFTRPWNFTTSAELACLLWLFDDYGLMIRGGHTYFKDEPVVLNSIPEDAYRAELKIQELSVSLSQVVRPFPFLWLEQGVALFFPVHTEFELYHSHLGSDGWTDFKLQSTERLDSDFYYSYPLLGLVHSVGLDISTIWRGSIPISLFYRQELGLVPMYLSSELFASTGKEQSRYCWGVRCMILNRGKPAPAPALYADVRRHNFEFALGVGGGLGNLQSVMDSERFHFKGMARASLRAAYVYRERYRLGLEAVYQLRQYTESEYKYKGYPYWTDPYRKDYYHDRINYLGGVISLDVFPVKQLFVGAGLGLAWILPFGNEGWRYVESDSGDAMIKSNISDPHEYYDYSSDPFLLVKCGTPLYRWSNIPLELDLTWQWGWRTPRIETGFYTATRPTYTSISLGIMYVLEVLK